MGLFDGISDVVLVKYQSRVNIVLKKCQKKINDISKRHSQLLREAYKGKKIGESVDLSDEKKRELDRMVLTAYNEMDKELSALLQQLQVEERRGFFKFGPRNT